MAFIIKNVIICFQYSSLHIKDTLQLLMNAEFEER